MVAAHERRPLILLTLFLYNMDPIITQGLITAGGGLGGSLINGALGIWQANKDREFNAEQAELNRTFQRDERLAAQAFDLDMWNLNNDYNDIGSQIERARAAGVNPMALLGGDYKSAQSNPVTTQPQSGSAATSSAGGSVGSALISSTAPLLASAVGGVKQLADAKVANQTLPLVKAELQSRVEHNYALIQKYAHENGYTDIQRDMVAKSIGWMDGLNQAEIKVKTAAATRDYNECYEIYQRIAESKNRMANDDARVAIERDVADANIHNINADTTSKDIANTYADRTLAAQMTIEEISAWEAEKRRQFAKDYDLVLGTSEFEFAWQLHCKGRYAEYCDMVIAPAEQATWKPEDYKQTYKDGLKIFGIPLFDKDNTEYAFPRSYRNPTYNQFNKGVSPYPIPAYAPYF